MDHRRRFTPASSAALISCLALAIFSQAAPAITVGDPSNPGSLQQAIVNAYNGGNTQITIAAGTYQETSALQLSNMTNVTLTASGVTLVSPLTGQFAETFYLYNCTNCIFQGFTMHQPGPQTVQGTIVAIGSDATGHYVDLHLHQGYSADGTRFQSVAYIFDQNTRTWKVGTGDSYNNTATAGPNGNTRLYLSSWSNATAVGDFVVGRGPGYHMVDVQKCTNCTFQDITIYYGGLFQFVESAGNGNHYKNCVVTYGPVPSGALVAPLLSASADAFHSIGSSVGPDVENCTFEGTPDDAISIRGTYEPIYSMPDSTHVIINGGDFVNGDSLVAQCESPGYLVSNVCTLVTTIATPTGAPSGTYHQLTLQNAMTPPSGTFVYNSSRTGSGFIVKNNTIRNNRARGCRVLASNGVVQNNTFDGTTMEAVLVQPVFWASDPEAGVAKNVQITGNTITRTGQAYGAGAIQIDPGTATAQNITVSNNTLSGVYGTWIRLANTSSDTVTNNLFINPPSVDLSPSGALLSIASTCSNLTVSGNAARFEGEDLTTVALNAPDQRVITFSGLSGGAAAIIDSTAVGQSVTYLLPGISAGSYALTVGAKSGPSRGTWQLACGRAENFSSTRGNAGPVEDEYTPQEGVTVFTLGTWSPSTSSDKWFQFTITGKSASSTGYTAAFDYIQLGQ